MTTTFTHPIRQPICAAVPHQDQHYYGRSNMAARAGLSVAAGTGAYANARLMRFASNDHAVLALELGMGSSVTMRLALRADEMRELARMLADAADDLERNPAPAAASLQTLEAAA